jgi:hypothetical protein
MRKKSRRKRKWKVLEKRILRLRSKGNKVNCKRLIVSTEDKEKDPLYNYSFRKSKNQSKLPRGKELIQIIMYQNNLSDKRKEKKRTSKVEKQSELMMKKQKSKKSLQKIK